MHGWFKTSATGADADHEHRIDLPMRPSVTCTRRFRRLAPAALVALCAGVVAAGSAFAAESTLQFTNVDRTPAPAAPIQLGTPPESPSLGVARDKVAFRTNRADRRALKAARSQERLRLDAEASRTASTRAMENIEALSQLLEQVQGDEARLREEIEARLVARYKSGDAGELEFLLSGDGLSGLVDRSRVLTDQAKRDRRTYEQYELTVGKLEDLKLVLEQLRDVNGQQAQRLDERADRLEDHLVAARAGHMEAADVPAGKNAGIDGTWYVMDGAFEAQLFLPSAGSGYTGGSQTPRRPPSMLQIQRVLSDPRIDLDSSGINDVSTGQIDGRLLDALSLAAERFGSIRITSLKSDHSVMTASGNVSAHSVGCAADIGSIGGTHITPASQTPGGTVDQAVTFLASLGGDLAPHQVISLFDKGGATLAMGDHGDHIHLGYSC